MYCPSLVEKKETHKLNSEKSQEKPRTVAGYSRDNPVNICVSVSIGFFWDLFTRKQALFFFSESLPRISRHRHANCLTVWCALGQIINRYGLKVRYDELGESPALILPRHWTVVHVTHNLVAVAHHSMFQERKSSPKRKFLAGYPCGHPAKNFGQALQILENKHFGTDIPRGRPRKKLRSEKLRADFPFPNVTLEKTTEISGSSERGRCRRGRSEIPNFPVNCSCAKSERKTKGQQLKGKIVS